MKTFKHESASILACILVITASVLLVWPRISLGSSIEQTTITKMTARAEIIFEGKVLSASSSLSKSRPVTCFVFQVLEILKGSQQGERIRLCFDGGTVDDLTLQVVGLTHPRVGELGIYFVESMAHNMVNPLYGWDQGRFLVKHSKSGPDTIVTSNGTDVLGIDPTTSTFQPQISEGVAFGVETRSAADSGGLGGAAMPVAEFKAIIAELRSGGEGAKVK